MNVHPIASTTLASKGPPVFLDMDQQALDEAYDQEIWAPNRALIVERRKAASERARAILGVPKRVAYGPSEHERLDIFDCGITGAPVNVFVHGGAWRRNVAADYALQAEPLVRAGAHCVIIDFINVDQAGGDLFPMYEQVRRALAWVWRNAESFGGDRDRLYVSAHSSGSHLSGVVLTRGWQEEGLPPDAFKGAVLLERHVRSRPGALSKRSSYVKFTDDDGASKLSGAAPPRRPAIRRSILAYGTCETPEFQRQSRDFAAAVKAAGKPVELIVGAGLQSFRIARDARQSLRPDRARHARADATWSQNRTENDNEPSRQGAGRARVRWSGSTWTRRRSTTPTTRWSMRRTAIRCTSATCSTATACARGSVRRSGCAYGADADRAARFVRRRPSRMRRSTCSSTAAPGGSAAVKDYAFMAEMFVRAGAHWIGLDFDGVEGTKGDLLPMADQVRRGVAWVYKNAKSFGGDPNRIYVSGQSSGAHLAGNVVTTDWTGLRRAKRHREGRAAVLGHV